LYWKGESMQMVLHTSGIERRSNVLAIPNAKTSEPRPAFL